jgi:hypothetical protein
MTAAAAHNDDDEPPADPGEAEMPAAAFQVIERAHEICDHAPAREQTAEPDCLITHAVKILGAQIRALALVREMKANGKWHDVELVDEMADESTDDDVEPLIIDWAEVALAAWAGEGWKDAAMDYQRARRGVRP